MSAQEKDAAIDVYVDINKPPKRIVFTLAELWRFIQVMKIYRDSEWYSEALAWLPRKKHKFFNQHKSIIQMVWGYQARILEMALLKTGGNKQEAARLLGIGRTTLVGQVKKLGIKVDMTKADEFDAPMCAQTLNELELSVIEDELELAGESTIANNLKRAELVVAKLITRKRELERQQEETSNGRYLQTG